MPTGRGVSRGIAVTWAGSGGGEQWQVGGQELSLAQGRGADWEESGVRLTEHREVGRGRGRAQEAVAGHAGVAARVIRLGGLQSQTPVHQDPHAGLQPSARWHVWAGFQARSPKAAYQPLTHPRAPPDVEHIGAVLEPAIGEVSGVRLSPAGQGNILGGVDRAVPGGYHDDGGTCGGAQGEGGASAHSLPRTLRSLQQFFWICLLEYRSLGELKWALTLYMKKVPSLPQTSFPSFPPGTPPFTRIPRPRSCVCVCACVGGWEIGFIICLFTLYIPHLSYLKSPLCVLPCYGYPGPYPKILQQPLIPAPHLCPSSSHSCRNASLWPRDTSSPEPTTAPGSYHVNPKLLDLASWALMIQRLPARPTVTDSGHYGQPALRLVPTALPLLQTPSGTLFPWSQAGPRSLVSCSTALAPPWALLRQWSVLTGHDPS